MPSDPSGVSPKGVLVRPAPDFFDDHLASGGFQFSGFNVGVTASYCTIALFNNSRQGTIFKVYGISITADGGDGFGFFFQYGTVGAFQSNCQPIRPDVGAPYGQIYEQQMSGAEPRVNDFYTGPFVNQVGGSGFDGNTVFSPFPMFIVPVGYSLVGTNITTCADFACYFWYQVCNE
jgi:hypothetical protein